MSFPRYERYKDSGVEWLGEVPEHWIAAKLKWHASIFSGSDQKHEDGIFPLYGANGIIGSTRDATKSCPRVLIGRVGSAGAVNYAMGKYGVSDNVLIIDNDEHINSRYCYYWIGNQDFSICVSKTAQPLLTASQISDFAFPLPTVSEQEVIATFLDYETAKIDALIAEQQRLINLLKEKRQAVISHAVTKGLNPDAPMKDSGIEWLGEVPEHWEVLKIRRIAASVETGGTPSYEPPSTEIEDGVVWYTPGDFGGAMLLKKSARKITKEAVASGEARLFPAHSVLIVSIGATLGKVGYIEEPASSNQQINAVIPQKLIDGYFLAYSLSVKSEVMRFLSNASTIGIMNQEKTKEILLGVPPLEEQLNIAAFLDRETAKLDALTAEAQTAIILLQERRTALISAAVTGKIDVRGFISDSTH
ncbi:restriction endonuclease subunit S [Thiobaca trueperi]|uniref:Type I restriction enzyme S subunit n=1 Tax=Thiobaca trueperi TaxID=127458 RepID=A0A4R3MZY1_9GAMM|nr:restriction endonuclease subunit S [Thiobaca trueperi]TCT22035.1 type I restriction enzyme S subunit [Thiobaca trueperi]